MADKKPVDPKDEQQTAAAEKATAPVLNGFCPRCGADAGYPRFDTKHKDGCSGRPL